MKYKKLASVIVISSMLLSIASCSKTDNKEETTAETTAETTIETTVETEETATTESTTTETTVETTDTYTNPYAGMTAEEIVSTLTLEQKAAQMILPPFYMIDADEEAKYGYGAIFSKPDDIPSFTNEEWQELTAYYQDGALASETGIPYFYGQDSVHGCDFTAGTIIYPHNINLGAANDIELTRKMGEYVASDMLTSRNVWNFGPCVAASQDPRWGRTYESISSDPSIVTPIAQALSEGLLSDSHIIVCAKHFICDGYPKYGTGEMSDVARIIDRGDSQVSEEVINDNLAIYQALIDSGVQTIMISHGSLNGVKMHENAEYIMKIKNEMGFKGFIVSDWDSIEKCSGKDLKENVILSVNSGIDMLMESQNFEEAMFCIIEAVHEGSISEERVDDAVTRIIQVKIDIGLFDDPYYENAEPLYAIDDEGALETARTLASESLVPLKADGGLTIADGSTIFVAGPAADDTGALLGGWTYIWQGCADQDFYGKVCPNATTILEALEEVADEHNYTIVTDESEISSCDVVLLCVGEKPYAEWNGDAVDLSITGDMTLEGNAEAIELAKNSGLPTITLLVAGRNVIIEDYINDWDSVIMCYLPGSEGGHAIVDNLTGAREYKGHLAMPYYKDEADIESGNIWLPIGFSAADN